MSDESLAAMESQDGPPPPIATTALMPESPGPVSRPQRISSLDVLRGVAVLGILMMNIVFWAMPGICYEDPGVVKGDAQGANLWAWIVTTMFFEGTFRTLFSMLFGAGVILLTSRLEARMNEREPGGLTVADIYYRRNIWLIVFGAFHAYVMLWIGDILYIYGLVGLVLYPFRRQSPAKLAAMAILMLAIVDATYQYESWHTRRLSADAAFVQAIEAGGGELTTEDQRTLEQWKQKVAERKPGEAAIARRIARGHDGYVATFVRQAPTAAYFESKLTYRNMFWDAAGMMFLGMALMKLGVLSGNRSNRAYWMMLMAGYAFGLAVNSFETWSVIRADFSIESMAFAWTTYDIGRLAMTIGHIGAIMLVIRSGALAWLIARLAACGQMALTNYLMQSVICGLIFNGYGLAQFGQWQRWQLYLAVAGVWIVQLLWSPWWLRHFQFGPAEWLWRSLTYWKCQPMRHINPANP